MGGDAVDPVSAEARAVEEGAHAFLQADGSFAVRSASRDGLRHRVTCEAVAHGGRSRVRFRCSCESGTARPATFVACWHGALVGRRLERDGWARWDSGAWWLTADGEARVAKADPRSATPWRARGPCPVCGTFMTVECAGDEDPRTRAAGHRPACRDEYERRRRAAAELLGEGEVDLWER